MDDKEFLTYEEAMEYLGCKRSTLYNLVTEMYIPNHKFKGNRRRYLAIADVKHLKEIRDKPWLAGPAKETEADVEAYIQRQREKAEEVKAS